MLTIKPIKLGYAEKQLIEKPTGSCCSHCGAQPLSSFSSHHHTSMRSSRAVAPLSALVRENKITAKVDLSSLVSCVVGTVFLCPVVNRVLLCLKGAPCLP